MLDLVLKYSRLIVKVIVAGGVSFNSINQSKAGGNIPLYFHL